MRHRRPPPPPPPKPAPKDLPSRSIAQQITYWLIRERDNENADQYDQAEHAACEREILRLRERQVAAYEDALVRIHAARERGDALGVGSIADALGEMLHRMKPDFTGGVE